MTPDELSQIATYPRTRACCHPRGCLGNGSTFEGRLSQDFLRIDASFMGINNVDRAMNAFT